MLVLGLQAKGLRHDGSHRQAIAAAVDRHVPFEEVAPCVGPPVLRVPLRELGGLLWVEMPATGRALGHVDVEGLGPELVPVSRERAEVERTDDDRPEAPRASRVVEELALVGRADHDALTRRADEVAAVGRPVSVNARGQERFNSYNYWELGGIYISRRYIKYTYLFIKWVRWCPVQSSINN